MSKTFLFQAIQFSQAILIKTIQFSISMHLVLFKPWIGPYQVLPFWARVDPGANWAIHRVNVKTVLFQMIQFNISTQF